jgi:hypothetical protein
MTKTGKLPRTQLFQGNPGSLATNVLSLLTGIQGTSPEF